MSCISDLTYNESTMTIVPVIASFDSSGNMKPLYLGVHGESYQILSCYSIKEFNFDFPTFRCRVNDHGIVRDIILKYHPSDQIWTIPKLPARWGD